MFPKCCASNSINLAFELILLLSFCVYLNHDPQNEYIFDLDNIWEWLGFSQKVRAKKLLLKHFKPDIDYKIALSLQRKQKNEGGHNKETILMNTYTFKGLCMKANTKKATEIHQYYIVMEEILHEYLKEEYKTATGNERNPTS